MGQSIANLAPLATIAHGAQMGVDAQQVFSTPSAPSQGVLSKFTGFLGNIFSETGHLAESAAGWLGKQVVNMAEAPVKFTYGTVRMGLDDLHLNQINSQLDQLSAQRENIGNAFRAGRMTGTQYSAAMDDLNKTLQGINNDTQATANRVNMDTNTVKNNALNTISAVVTVMTAGIGGEAVSALKIGADGASLVPQESAANWLASAAAKPLLDSTASFISKTISQPEIFKALTPELQAALQRSTAEVIATGAKMTAPQIARATATNLALKYPLYYATIAPQAQLLYKELDNNRYGAAVWTVAFNAALLLSGGPIGQAVKYGGKALTGVSAKTFGATSFWDELSKYYGDGTPSGFRDAVVKATANMGDAEKSVYLRNLSAVEATNVAAAGSGAAAANRVATGLAANEGVDLQTVTHDEALKNMVNFADAQRIADQTAQDAGLGKVAVGRVDARALNDISAKLAVAPDVTTRLQSWDTLKQQNPTQAWANNANFDAQMKNLITNHPDVSELDTAIRNIKAQFSVEGFPKSVATKLSKMGYIPIKPALNEAPFKEGAGAITSKFAQEGDVWTKAVQPLPVLGTLGSLVTRMGLSPQNATQRVYQIYNTNLAKNLVDSGLAERLGVHGDTPEQTADTLIKQLSSYAHEPTRGGMNLAGAKIRPPITDLRQLTTKDIMAALGATRGEAKEVASNLMGSMLEVPLAVRGLGDKIVDLNYKLNPTAKAYARIQGASRFSWNPFFQVKLAYKTEALSQLESHGKMPTIAGTNKIMSVIFPEHYAKLDSIRTTLRDNGIFEEKSKAVDVVSGEGVNDTGVGSANLTHKLIPSQEISIAGLVATQADKMGLSVDEYVKNFPNDVRDSVQTIAQYDRRSQFLNSPLARTLNLAFFPFRFETKVAMVMAKSLATTSPMTQLAVIKGLYNGSNFMKSPEGQVWYSQNSDVIKLLTYFTPVTTLSYFATALGGKPDSVGAFGELGGLPLGWIPQLLDAEGVTHLTQSAYLDPKSGNEIPNYVPATDKGRLLVAVQDLIGQLFTYPGSEVGLPSKTSITRNIALGVTGASKKVDLQQAGQMPLSQSQQSFQQAVQQANPQPTAQQNTTMPQQQNQPVPGQTVPASTSPLTTPTPKSTRGSGKKLKKSQFTPALMPGQTQLGAIPGVQ
jgi:hypothetical protein